ncbi:hypothetical protein ACLBKT_02510 [Erythrobacter sp. W302b]|uniref:hypothetical protein n=1 Tax=Erythrobacter sp. W302b TaxID=3389874 RepID=UPI00396B15C0
MSVDWPIVFQGVKTVLDPISNAAWPISIGAIAWAFRKPITAMIGRVRQVSGFGGTAEFNPPEIGSQQSADATKASLPALTDTSIAPPSDPVYDALDAQLKANLDKHIQGGAEVKLAWAIRSRSISEANRMHETNYRLLFGSQIAALKSLNVTGPAPISEFEKYYATVASNPANEPIHKDRSFNQWADFVVNIGYVVAVEGSNPALAQITPFGHQFLQWMTANGVSEFKPG